MTVGWVQHQDCTCEDDLLNRCGCLVGDTLASCSGDKTVRLWTRKSPDSEEWLCSAILEEAQARTIRCCSWAPGGRQLATASFDATTAIWEVQVQTHLHGRSLFKNLGCKWASNAEFARSWALVYLQGVGLLEFAARHSL